MIPRSRVSSVGLPLLAGDATPHEQDTLVMKWTPVSRTSMMETNKGNGIQCPLSGPMIDKNYVHSSAEFDMVEHGVKIITHPGNTLINVPH